MYKLYIFQFINTALVKLSYQCHTYMYKLYIFQFMNTALVLIILPVLYLYVQIIYFSVYEYHTGTYYFISAVLIYTNYKNN